jgi:hypothetical protein
MVFDLDQFTVGGRLRQPLDRPVKNPWMTRHNPVGFAGLEQNSWQRLHIGLPDRIIRGRRLLMKELTDSRWIKLKGGLFLVVGVVSSLLLLFECRSWKVGLLLLVTIWCFCRFYYFAFYVIEHYVDPSYRFSGLWSFARYLWSSRR